MTCTKSLRRHSTPMPSTSGATASTVDSCRRRSSQLAAKSCNCAPPGEAAYRRSVDIFTAVRTSSATSVPFSLRTNGATLPGRPSHASTACTSSTRHCALAQRAAASSHRRSTKSRPGRSSSPASPEVGRALPQSVRAAPPPSSTRCPARAPDDVERRSSSCMNDATASAIASFVHRAPAPCAPGHSPPSWPPPPPTRARRRIASRSAQ
mmetsp:Transcript_29695/g.78908  ORF Transcript_29695/g.78908 Transcript_29695/m.78908 type:complete len:209 (-) Transcript_29695:1-627(-)